MGSLFYKNSMYSLSMYNLYDSWNTDRYINKIKVGAIGKVRTNLTYQEVQEACGLKNYDNN